MTNKPIVKQLLLVISGPSGSGKSTIAKAIVEQYTNFVLSVSFTTRTIRVGEINNKDYYFVSSAEFKKMRATGHLLEITELCGNLYATSRSKISELIHDGKNIIFDVDYQGAKIIKENWPDNTICIFIEPPSLESTKERLVARQDDLKNIDERIKKFDEVMASKNHYDYVVINDVLEDAVLEIKRIIDINLYN